jgi:hypothetical protein
MAPRKIKSLSLPERLRIEIEKVATAQERSVNDVLAEAVDHYVKDKRWASLKQYGREKARECEIGEADVDRLVAESRNSMIPSGGSNQCASQITSREP